MSYAEAAYFRAVMEEMKVHVYQVAAAFSLWGKPEDALSHCIDVSQHSPGLHVALACYATRLIWYAITLGCISAESHANFVLSI